MPVRFTFSSVTVVAVNVFIVCTHSLIDMYLKLNYLRSYNRFSGYFVDSIEDVAREYTKTNSELNIERTKARIEKLENAGKVFRFDL